MVKKLTCSAIIKKYKLTGAKFKKLVLEKGIPEVRRRYNLTPGQFYTIKKLLKVKYPSQRNSEISQEYLREQALKAKTMAILPKTVKEYHEFYYGNVSPAEQQRRRKGYEGFFKYYGK